MNSLGLDQTGKEAHMVAIIFSVLSVAACTFLIYVSVHFHRELMRLRKSAGQSSMTEADIRRIEAGLMWARMSSHGDLGKRARTNAATQQQILIGGKA
jgi:hypothetical protein